MRRPHALAGALVFLGLAGCARPDWTDPARSHDRRVLAAAPRNVAPVPVVDRPLPPPPAWAQPLIGRPLRSVFRKSGMCLGKTERIDRRYADGGVELSGWGWDLKTKKPVARVLLVDSDRRIVGAGEGGVLRPELRALEPQVTDPRAGWEAHVIRQPGLLKAYGVAEGGAGVCPVGDLEL